MLAVVCKVLVACPSPDAGQVVNINFWSLKLVAFPHPVSASAWQEPCQMFWLHPMNIQAVNAQHRNGLVAAEGCAWGRETLKRCKKRSSLSPSSATHPLCSEIMNVPACGVPHSTTAHALALEGPGEAPRCVVAQEMLSSPKKQTARRGGCAGRGYPSPTRHCLGGDSGSMERGARPGCQWAG